MDRGSEVGVCLTSPGNSVAGVEWTREEQDEIRGSGLRSCGALLAIGWLWLLLCVKHKASRSVSREMMWSDWYFNRITLAAVLKMDWEGKGGTNSEAIAVPQASGDGVGWHCEGSEKWWTLGLLDVELTGFAYELCVECERERSQGWPGFSVQENRTVELRVTEMSNFEGKDGKCSFGHVKLEMLLDRLVPMSSG